MNGYVVCAEAVDRGREKGFRIVENRGFMLDEVFRRSLSWFREELLIMIKGAWEVTGECSHPGS